VADSVGEPSAFDYRVRQKIKESIEIRVSYYIDDKPNCPTCQLRATFQLAFCYRLGFGVNPDLSKASRLLETIGEEMHALEEEIKFLQTSTQIHFNNKMLYDLVWKRNYNTMNLSIQYLKHMQLEEVASCQKREISNMEAPLSVRILLLEALKTY